MQATEAFDGGKPMTLLEHLLELRSRLIWCALALVVAVIISSIFTSRVMLFLVSRRRSRRPTSLIVTEPMENITVFFGSRSWAV
jgi:Sec-independent protein secretion pathway component TatC